MKKGKLLATLLCSINGYGKLGSHGTGYGRC